MVHDIIIFSSNEGDRVWCCYLWAFNLITIIVYVHAFQRIEHITTLLLWKRNTMIHHNGTQSIMLLTYTPNKYIHKYYDPRQIDYWLYLFILFYFVNELFMYPLKSNMGLHWGINLSWVWALNGFIQFWTITMLSWLVCWSNYKEGKSFHNTTIM